MTLPVTADTVYQAESDLLAGVKAAIDEWAVAGGTPIAWGITSVVNGDPAYDCTGGWMLFVQVADLGINESVAAVATAGAGGDSPYHRRGQSMTYTVNLIVTLAFCFSVGKDGQPSVPLEAIARDASGSAYAALNAGSTREWFDTDQVLGVQAGRIVPFTPSGAITGWVWPVSVEVQGYTP